MASNDPTTKRRRVYTQIGDIFAVPLVAEQSKRYIQLVALDMSQLNSDVIRAFKKGYALDAQPAICDIVNDEVDFFVHTTVSAGVKQNLWKKTGKSLVIGNVSLILFKDTLDYGRRDGELPVTDSQKWVVWQINGNRKFVGILDDKNRNAFMGLVVPPNDVVRMLLGKKIPIHYPS